MSVDGWSTTRQAEQQAEDEDTTPPPVRGHVRYGEDHISPALCCTACRGGRVLLSVSSLSRCRHSWHKSLQVHLFVCSQIIPPPRSSFVFLFLSKGPGQLLLPVLPSRERLKPPCSSLQALLCGPGKGDVRDGFSCTFTPNYIFVSVKHCLDGSRDFLVSHFHGSGLTPPGAAGS